MECKPCDSKKLCKVFDASNRHRRKNGLDNSDSDTDASKSVVTCQTSKQLLDTELSARHPVEKRRSTAGSSSGGSRACAASPAPPPAPRHPHTSTPHLPHASTPHLPRTNRRKGSTSLALKPGIVSSPRSESPDVTPRSILQTEAPVNVAEGDEGSIIYDFLEQALKKKRHKHHTRRREERSPDAAELRDAHHHRRKLRRHDDHAQLIETFVNMYAQLQEDTKTKEADVVIQKSNSKKSLHCQYKDVYSDIDRKPSKLNELIPSRDYRNKTESREKLSECGSNYNAEIPKKHKNKTINTACCSNSQRQIVDSKYARDNISRNCDDRSSRERYCERMLTEIPRGRTCDERRKERYNANIDDEKHSRERYSEQMYDGRPSKERYCERIYDDRPSKDRNSERIYNRTSKERYNEKICREERKENNGRNYGKNDDRNRIYENTQRDKMCDEDRYTNRRRSDIERDRYENDYRERCSPKRGSEYREKNSNLHRDSDMRRYDARYLKIDDRDSVQSVADGVDSMGGRNPSSDIYESPTHLRNDASSLSQKNRPTTGKEGITDPAIQHEVAEQRQAVDKMMQLWQELMHKFKDITDNVGRSERVVQETAVAAREGTITQMQLWRECMQRYESVARDVGDTDARLKEELQKQKTEISEMSTMWQECLTRYREMSSHLTSLKQQISVEQAAPPPLGPAARAPPATPCGEGSPTPYPYVVPPVYPCPQMYAGGSPMRPRASAPTAGPPPPWWWSRGGCGASPARPRRTSLDSRSEHSHAKHHRHRDRERGDKHHGKERSTSKVNVSRSDRRRKK